MKLMIVGGTYENKGTGKHSYLIDRLHQMAVESERFDSVKKYNGGPLSILNDALELCNLADFEALIWMPNIDNAEDKMLPYIKNEMPKLILVQSKRVIEKEYSDFDIIKHALDSHSSLCIKITWDDSYKFEIVDPLGNSWNKPDVLEKASRKLFLRIEELNTMHRQGSICISPEEYEFELEPEFLHAVKILGEEFTKHIIAVNPNRFLGNASTRCSHGFPSCRKDDYIFMSIRNVDKTIISSDQFVPIEPYNYDLDNVNYSGKSINYIGLRKPSIDAPVQKALYRLYPCVNYIVHGHAYIKDAPCTYVNIPCGYLEEVDEIVDLIPDATASDFVINLDGHGCLIFASTVNYLLKHKFEKRPFLEKQY